MKRSAEPWSQLCHACAAPVKPDSQSCPACGAALSTVAAEISYEKRRWYLELKQLWPEIRNYLAVFAFSLAVALLLRAIQPFRPDFDPQDDSTYFSSYHLWFYGLAGITLSLIFLHHRAQNRFMNKAKALDKKNREHHK